MPTPRSTIRTWESCDQELALLKHNRGALAIAQARLDDDLRRAREKHDEQLHRLAGLIAASERDIELFAVEHRADFGEAKSKALVHGVLKFRTTPPRVQTLNRKHTFDTVLQAVQAVAKFARRWVRSRIELDKAAILSDYADARTDDAELASLGLRISQAETLTIDTDERDPDLVPAAQE